MEEAAIADRRRREIHGLISLHTHKCCRDHMLYTVQAASSME